MMKLLDRVPYPALILVTVLLGLAPFYPMPHVAEKLIMLFSGTLTRPVDVFDLVYHSAPGLILTVKAVRDIRSRKS